jgi:hypothetical protein
VDFNSDDGLRDRSGGNPLARDDFAEQIPSEGAAMLPLADEDEDEDEDEEP